MRNRYKFNENIGSGIGSYKGGILTLSAGDLKRINGKGDLDGPSPNEQRGGGKRTKQIKKGGRDGGRNGKKKSRHHKK